jgi:DNA-binding IclR family transcriptional regulator
MKRDSDTKGEWSGKDATGSRYRVAAADKVLDLLNAFITTSRPHTLVSLAATTGIPTATAFRMLSTLEDQGFVAKSATAEYTLGYKCLLLGNAVEAGLELRAEAIPLMEGLRDRSGESVQIAILEHWQVVYIERVLSLQPVGFMTSRTGSILPAYCTGLGKCLLAYMSLDEVLAWANTVTFPRLTAKTLTSVDELLNDLSAVRERGYSVDDQERQPGVSCIAAPIRNSRGEVIAAISVAGPNDRLPAELVGSELARQVVATANAVSQRMGYLAQPLRAEL